MIDRIPTIVFFTRGYWNQTGPDIYGSIDRALMQMLMDTRRMPDKGVRLLSDFKSELREISNSKLYEDWLREARFDVNVINSVGGAFVMPDQVLLLLGMVECFELQSRGR
jgi:hypothetical protein